MRNAALVALVWLLCALAPLRALAQGTSLRVVNDRNANPTLIQRVRIVIGSYDLGADLSPPMDLGDSANAPGGTFTVELWIRGVAPENNAGESGCVYDPAAWVSCAIFVDRDINGTPSFGDFGLSVCNDGALRAGVMNASTGVGLCAPFANLLDGAWHHIAFTRNGLTGEACIFTDGVQRDCGAGPIGAISFNDTSSSLSPGVSPSGQDPTLVLGAEKHGYTVPYPGFRGWIDEARFSSLVRYSPCGDGVLCFTRPSAPFVADGSTLGLYHFDDGVAGARCSCAGSLSPLIQGTCVADASGRGTSAECRWGSAEGRFGPQFSAFTPFGGDADGDSVSNASDVCPFTPNPLQFDTRGYQTTTSDGIGDACQCGDTDEDYAVFPAQEAARLRNTLAGLAPGVVNLAKCSVIGGPNDCNLLDLVVLRRAAAIPPRPPGIAEVCDAAVP